MSTFGSLFQVTTFGESHCYGVGCIVTGVPPRMRLSTDDIQIQLNRRRPGQSKLTTQRNEKDQALIMSGVEFGYTLGTPIAVLVRNEDQRPGDYGGSSAMHDIPRPSHADYTYQEKYGIRASSGGGRASARETIGRVIAGAIAEKWLAERYTPNASIENTFSVVAYVSSVANIHAPELTDAEHHLLTRDMVDSNLARCPHVETSQRMIDAITQAKAEHDSLGGTITCVIKNVPSGLGEPTFDKLQAMLAHAMLSIPATKGFEYGSGFKGTEMRGSMHNDMFTKYQIEAQNAAINSSNSNNDGSNTATKLSTRLRTITNRSGGIQGGISNGENITFRIAFKPPATIGIAQNTADFEGIARELKAEGRHDPCVLPRAVPIVEAMAALVIADAAMIQSARENAASSYGTMARVNPRDLYKSSKLTGGFSEQEQLQQFTSQIPSTPNGTSIAATPATQQSTL